MLCIVLSLGLSSHCAPFTIQVLIGNRTWMVRNGIDVTPEMEEQLVHHEERGHTVVLAAINSEQGVKPYCFT